MSGLITRAFFSKVRPSTLNYSPCFNYASRLYCQKPPNPSEALKNPSKSGATYKPDKVDKLLLVWMKKYPSVSAVPNLVTDDMMEKVRNMARIRITIILCILTGAACFFMIWLGKRDAKQGKTLQKMNEEWHKSMREKDTK